MTAAARRHSKRVGYVRVSTLDQNTERQLGGQELDTRTNPTLRRSGRSMTTTRATTTWITPPCPE
jgi:hypothetical protein